MRNTESIKKEFPLHFAVWNNDFDELQKLLKTDKHDKEKTDPRGRTPLMLAVKLSHLQSVKCLLAAKCNANFECEGWSIVQEAVCTGDEAIVTAILEVRDLQRNIQRVTHVPKLLQLLLDAPDFYIEIKWEFTSWVPLMSRFCPSDTYKVYKRGANVRIDTTLLGFDSSWIRGNRSYIFKGQNDTATMIEIDHDRNEVLIEKLNSDIGNLSEIVAIPPPPGSVRSRLQAPVMTNNIDMDKISFERNKSGIWGWRSEKSEVINSYNCKVFGASNVEFITKTRTEHLSEEQLRSKNSRTPLHSFLGIAEDEYNANPDLVNNRECAPSPHPEVKIENDVITGEDSASCSSGSVTPKTAVTPEEYFTEEFDLNGRDIGRPKKTNTKVQRFKANLWLSEEYPIRLQEQVLPILDLMSTMASPHVSKLREFITMQLPSGFPVKIEIPLLHVLNACITFGNVFSLTSPVENVHTINEDDRITCIVDDRCFEIPTHYTNRDNDARRHVSSMEDEDDLLQYAIEQSLAENSNNGDDCDKVDIWEALRSQRGTPSPSMIPEEEAQMQRVLQESLSHLRVRPSSGSPSSENNDTESEQFIMDPDLELALGLSQQAQQEYEMELKREQEMIEEALRLSLEDK